MYRKYVPLLVSILISLGVGGLSGFFIRNDVGVYSLLHQPPLSPPSFVFPVVWTILYILMGISAYRIAVSKENGKTIALVVYGLQLVVNSFWSILFFHFQLRFFAFLWIIFLLFLIIMMIQVFYRVDKTAAYLQIPYLLWTIFATYLSFGFYLLNQ